MRTEGWWLFGWLALGLSIMVAWILGAAGLSEDGIRQVIRATARTSLVLFSLAFTASSLQRLIASSLSNWLLRNRRAIGVSFGFSHFLHLAAIVLLALEAPEPFFSELDPISFAGGGLVSLFVAAMVFTSFDRSAAWLGARLWSRLHKIGIYGIWLVFLITYAPRALQEPRYLLAPVLLVGVLALRFAPRRLESSPL